MKKLKLKLSPATVVAVVFGVFATFGAVYAYQGYTPPKVVVEGNYIESSNVVQKAVEPVQEQSLGVANGNLVSNFQCVNKVCTYSLVQTFIDASTTIVSIPDPFLMVTSSASDIVLVTDEGGLQLTGATTTVSVASLQITDVATTTFTVSCGSAATANGAPSKALISSGSVVTSTGLGFIENNLTAALGGAADGGTVPKIAMGPIQPYFTCVVTPTVSGGFTNANNTFDGKATVVFTRTR